MDRANPKLWFSDSGLDKLTLLKFHLSANDIAALAKETRESMQNKFHSTNKKVFRKINLSFEDKQVSAKISLHGTNMSHWSRSKKSIDVKINKGEPYFNRMRKFSLLIPDSLGYLLPLMTSKVTRELKLLSPETYLVRGSFNGRNLGLYFLEEKVDNDFLERQGKPNDVIIKLSDNWAEDHYTNFFGIVDPQGHHITPLDHEIGNLADVKSDKAELVYAATGRLFRFLKASNLMGLRSILDLDAFARHETYRTLFGKSHDAAGDNLRLTYSLMDGKFRPVARSEGECRTLKIQGGSFAHDVNFYNERPILLFVRLNHILEYRKLKYLHLHSLVKKYPALRSELDKIKNASQNLALFDENDYFPIAVKEKVIRENLESIDRNVNAIRTALNSARIYINVFQYPSRIEFEIVPDSEVPIRIDTMRILFKDKLFTSRARLIYGADEAIQPITNGFLDLSKLLKNKSFMPRFDKHLKLKRTAFRFGIQFDSKLIPEIEKLSFKAVNGITEKTIPKENRYVKVSKSTHLNGVMRNSSEETFIAFYSDTFPNMKIKDKKIIFPKGQYLIKSNLIIPIGFEVSIEAGAQFLMDPGASFISFSSVNINGLKKAPVIIRPQKPGKSFGTFAVVGAENSPFHSKIQWLDLSGGSETLVNGIYFSGGLSLHRVNVDMENSTIHHNAGDDGLNVKYGNVRIANSKFVKNFSDQIDCDFCVGVFKNNFFFGGENSNGDGLDLSGSFIKVIRNQFETLNDKGISVGENTRVLLYKNKIVGSGIGAAVKDLSRAYLIENLFERNKKAVSVYRKKPIFGGGRVYFLKNRFRNNVTVGLIDKHSSLSDDFNELDTGQLNFLGDRIKKPIKSGAQYFKDLQVILGIESKK
tara:strand:- start:5926 stop:8541 length:2616 start_codon:yes stop_codon:yes gene_type:complete